MSAVATPFRQYCAIAPVLAPSDMIRLLDRCRRSADWSATVPNAFTRPVISAAKELISSKRVRAVMSGPLDRAAH